MITRFSQVASDNFAGTGPLSGNWTQQDILSGGDTVSRNSGKAQPDTQGNVDCVAYWTANLFTPNQYSQAIVSGLSADHDFSGVVVRASGVGNGNANCYTLTTDGTADGTTDHTSFAKFINSVGTPFFGLSTAFSNGDLICLAIIGSTLYAYKNGVFIASAVDTDIATGSPGIDLYDSISNSARSANWSGGNVVFKPGTLALLGVGI